MQPTVLRAGLTSRPSIGSCSSNESSRQVRAAADAGALGKARWDAYVAAGRIDPQQLRIFWSSPGYCHYNFTARADFPAELAHRFTQAILAMDYQQPEQKRIMDLEGLTRWVPGRTERYQALVRSVPSKWRQARDEGLRPTRSLITWTV